MPGSFAQGLGAAAEKEKEKKKPRKPAPGRVYTEEDLKKAREDGKGNVIFVQGEASPSPEEAASPSPEAGEPDRAALEAQWRARAAAKREAIVKADARIASLEARITALRNDVSVSGLTDPFRLQGIQSELNAALAELDQARASALAARKDLEALEDEARRSRIPAGWLREP